MYKYAIQRATLHNGNQLYTPYAKKISQSKFPFFKFLFATDGHWTPICRASDGSVFLCEVEEIKPLFTNYEDAVSYIALHKSQQTPNPTDVLTVNFQEL